ncbi:MAG TPA: EAL domain-containing protein [bacterium]|nr:EAL domain-containing protein [bacterium]
MKTIKGFFPTSETLLWEAIVNPVCVTILHVEKSPGDSRWLESVFRQGTPSGLSFGFDRDTQCRVMTVPDVGQACAKLKEGRADVALLESAGAEEEDLRAISRLHLASPDLPIIVLSPDFHSEALSRLLGNGVQEYLVRGEVNGDRICHAVRSAVERQKFQAQKNRAMGDHLQNFNVLMDMSLDGVAVFRDGVVLAANPAFDRILGYERHGTEGTGIAAIARPEYRGHFEAQIGRGVDQPRVLAAQKKDHAPIFLEYTIRPCRYEDHPAQVIDIHDITERRKAEEALRHQAHWDFVTELPNRYLFFERLNKALQQAHQTAGKVALFYIDLDRFKIINDTLGHSAGDQLLKVVSRRLTQAVRWEDTVARLGGDEFSIILRNVHELEDVAAVARKVLESLTAPVQIHENELHVSASIGISIFPDDAQTPEKLIQRADVAMYQAKEKGRNAFCLYHDAMDAGGLQKLDLQNSLYRAVEDGNFYLLYQPQFELATGKVVGLEALLRWNHPVRGPVSPTEFIPLTEETGLIILLGQWVLRKACAQNKAWQQQGLPPVRVSVNLSAVQFLKHTLPFLIDRILKETGLEPRFLELEITEGLAMRDPIFTLAILREMTEIFKLRIALDDFGMAYSSLGYLKHFPLHCLKIDKSFVGGIGRSPKDDAIVSAIIVLAQKMGLEVVAEGVETEAQLEFLRNHGCNTCQGFLFAQPLNTEEVEKLLREEPGNRLPKSVA